MTQAVIHIEQLGVRKVLAVRRATVLEVNTFPLMTKPSQKP